MRKNVKIFIAILSLIVALLAVCGCGYFKFVRHTVNFYDGDELIKSVVARDPSSVIPPEMSDKEGYEFAFWKERDGEVAFSDKTEFADTEDFIAVWRKKNYSVYYVLNGGTNGDNPSTYTIEDEFTLSDATFPDMIFLGWTSDLISTPQKSVKVEKGTFGDLTFIANFADESISYLYFDSNGGSLPKRQSSDSGRFDSEPESVKTGYEFCGWYFDQTLIYKAVFPLVTEDKITTLYAKWAATTYHVYSADGSFETIEYDIETPDFIIPAPEKTGYNFVGFSVSGGEITADLIVPCGSHKDYYVYSHFEVIDYVLSFDSRGGSEVADIVANYGDLLFLPTPEKIYCEFIGWYIDLSCTEIFALETMPAKSFTLYAGWYSEHIYTLSFSADVSGADIKSDRSNGENVTSGEPVSIFAPAYIDGAIFERWDDPDGVYSYDNALEFSMPLSDVTLVARYDPITTVTYSLDDGGDLVINANGSVSAVKGVGLVAADYALSGDSASISREFMQELESGYYPLVMTVDGESVFITVKVVSAARIGKVRIDYDICYPAASLLIGGADEEDLEYSLDGSPFLPANDINVLDNYDKSAPHSFTVRVVSEPDKSVTVTRAGSENYEREYLTDSFEYGGRTYDKLIESDEELQACIDYLMFVYAPENCEPSSTESGSISYSFGFGKVFYESIKDDVVGALSICFNRASVPYAPSIKYSYSSRAATVTVEFNTDEPNMIRSTQTAANISDRQALLKKSDRADDYDDFAIDYCEKTQVIRTIYELEDLPFGVKPVFKTNDGQAYEVYKKAKEILRSIVSDDMNDLEKVTAIYDYLALTVTYDDVTAAAAINDEEVGQYRAFTSYGALIDRVAVCDGIASAFAIMCRIEGIECIEVTGEGNSGAHAWNKVKIGGLWYGADATWSHIRVTSGWTEYLYVTHEYLFMNEKTSFDCGHEEGGTLIAALKNTDNCAISSLDYYSADILGGADHTASSGEELAEIIRIKYADGATAFEVKFTDGTDVSKVVDKAGKILHRRLTQYSFGNDVYLLLLN